MEPKTYLTIVLRKEVPTVDAGQQLFNFVKDRLADKPEIDINGNINTKLNVES